MKFCAEPTCRTLVHKGRCPVHAPEHERTHRPQAHLRGYDETWRRFSAARLQRFPFCGQQADGSMSAEHGSRCAEVPGRCLPAECTDHIVPMSQGGAQYDEANLQSLCLACNSFKANTLERR